MRIVNSWEIACVGYTNREMNQRFMWYELELAALYSHLLPSLVEHG